MFRDSRRADSGEIAMILITGASGNAGGAVLHEVLKSGSGVRAMIRSKEDTAKVPQVAAAVIADFADKRYRFVELLRASTPFIWFARRYANWSSWKAT
jgi:nucleoside-diphosphate-sugar epimerase